MANENLREIMKKERNTIKSAKTSFRDLSEYYSEDFDWEYDYFDDDDDDDDE